MTNSPLVSANPTRHTTRRITVRNSKQRITTAIISICFTLGLAPESGALAESDAVYELYAGVPVEQAKQAVANNSGVMPSGPSWSTDFFYHYDWATSGNGANKKLLQDQVIQRIQHLRGMRMPVPSGIAPVRIECVYGCIFPGRGRWRQPIVSIGYR